MPQTPEQTPAPSFVAIGNMPERRRGPDRRATDRRHSVGAPDSTNRRSGAERRRFERRETATGHLRNALQVLESLVMTGRLDGELREQAVAAARRLWLALREIERYKSRYHDRI